MIPRTANSVKNLARSARLGDTDERDDSEFLNFRRYDWISLHKQNFWIVQPILLRIVSQERGRFANYFFVNCSKIGWILNEFHDF